MMPVETKRTERVTWRLKQRKKNDQLDDAKYGRDTGEDRRTDVRTARCQMVRQRATSTKQQRKSPARRVAWQAREVERKGGESGRKCDASEKTVVERSVEKEWLDGEKMGETERERERAGHRGVVLSPESRSSRSDSMPGVQGVEPWLAGRWRDLDTTVQVRYPPYVDMGPGGGCRCNIAR